MPKQINKAVFEQYEVSGFPNHFYTVEATDRYNQKLGKWCRKIRENAEDLTALMKIKRYIYVRFLDIVDVAAYKKQQK